MPLTRQDLGTSLRRLRQAAGLSVPALAAKVNTSPALLTAIERGQPGFDTVLMRALAKALEVPVDAFFPPGPQNPKVYTPEGLAAEPLVAFGRRFLADTQLLDHLTNPRP